MDFLRCVVERITYQNIDNGYSVLKTRAKGYNDLVCVVGNMATVNVGSVLSLSGEWRNDSKFGRQFFVFKWTETLPSTIYGVEKYLGSGMIKGLGPKFAKRIVDNFGIETLKIIEESPDRLIEVEGIGRKRVESVKKAWIEQKEIKNVMLFLTEHNISTAYATRIYKMYGNKSIEIMRENPYKLADDIFGIGFLTSDKIAEKLGFDKEGYVRCRGGVFFTLNELSNDGHCFATREQLIKTAVELLEIDESRISMTLDHLINEKEIIREEEANIYLPALYYSEVGVTKRLHDLHISRSDKTTDKVIANMDSLIEKAKQKAFAETGVKYSDIQESAIKQSVISKTLVVTGGPGTGKTTTILGIISILKLLDMKIILAAPTGRAAKRMSETCAMESKTIHRLLNYKPPKGFTHDAENPIDGDVLILDECSMIDIVLMNNLLKALPNHMKIIFVGDIDQLPSVGAGNVLKDIIESEKIATIRLTSIFRQAKGSDIISNAHRINDGKMPVLNSGKNSDFFFMRQDDKEKIPQMIVDLCRHRLPKQYKINPITDIQVICPMNRSVNGAGNLNIVLQQALNPSTIFLKRGGVEYRLYDKAMQVKNNYYKSCFNKSRTRDLLNYPEEIKMPKKAINLMKQ